MIYFVRQQIYFVKHTLQIYLVKYAYQIYFVDPIRFRIADIFPGL